MEILKNTLHTLQNSSFMWKLFSIWRNVLLKRHYFDKNHQVNLSNFYLDFQSVLLIQGRQKNVISSTFGWNHNNTLEGRTHQTAEAVAHCRLWPWYFWLSKPHVLVGWLSMVDMSCILWWWLLSPTSIIIFQFLVYEFIIKMNEIFSCKQMFKILSNLL